MVGFKSTMFHEFMLRLARRDRRVEVTAMLGDDDLALVEASDMGRGLNSSPGAA